MEQITLSVELSSEAPGVNSDWPSDISFFLNDVKLGTWTSPGDFGDIRGIKSFHIGFSFNLFCHPIRQYQSPDQLQVVFLGIKLLPVRLSTIRFKFQVASDAKNVGGLTLFGNGFGNYDQGIKARISYKSIS